MENFAVMRKIALMLMLAVSACTQKPDSDVSIRVENTREQNETVKVTKPVEQAKPATSRKPAKPVEQAKPATSPKPAGQAEPRQKDIALRVKSVYDGEIGVREKTGKNDGKRVEQYLKATGLGRGNPWCAAFVRWVFDEAGVKTNITAWSPTAYDKNKIVWKNGRWRDELRPGHVFTLYYQRLGRIGHTGFVDRMQNDKIAVTVEGNTNGEGSREGDGVYRKKRSLNAMFAICDFY